ncbi:hypothetical protein [Allonocardiopsis opalescens]|uniref:FXSXX-COOH protein n=1 Tax=Allonocardiopsis opalescens TaxID=1144618 RepID=A0A2T0Q2C8_9ACTN|nr:hypothetical protein [Allonocardiopsis opalescens]PRX97828.1 hypothetical protein CLV72_105178 [Allonocardiopsis opalescens]
MAAARTETTSVHPDLPDLSRHSLRELAELPDETLLGSLVRLLDPDGGTANRRWAADREPACR